MNKFELAENIKDAFGCSTKDNNAFAKFIESHKCDDEFMADGERCFIDGDLFLSTPSLDPFDCLWHPDITFMSSGYTFEL